ncbi:MAG: D-alanyl-D-alanine carboxypeptidase family protein [Actinomycetota bacterium]|nr:D-alanyl-D-alanine carboxypeptidase family protein [Actinomycetota bacterium]
MVKEFMTRKLAVFLLFIFILGAFWPAQVAAQPAISAQSGILIDVRTGQVLWEKNPHQKRSIASTTKIMTAVLVLERAQFTDVVTTSQKAADVGEAELYLSPGEQRTVEELLYGLLLKSANDAAMTLAEHVGGSVEHFVELMNKKAELIGARNTNFTNPHGLTDGSHHSTAYDLSLIARYALLDPEFAKIVSTEHRTIPWPDNQYPRELENHNKLLKRYPYADGVKTGYTTKAGHCLVASATKDETKLLLVVLGSPTSEACYTDSERLLDYGFTNFRRERVVRRGKVYKAVNLPVWEGEKLNLIAASDLFVQVKQNPHTLESKVSFEEPKVLPIFKGQKFGEVIVTQDGLEFERVDLVAQKDIPKPAWWQRVVIFVRSFLGRLGR